MSHCHSGLCPLTLLLRFHGDAHPLPEGDWSLTKAYPAEGAPPGSAVPAAQDLGVQPGTAPWALPIQQDHQNMTPPLLDPAPHPPAVGWRAGVAAWPLYQLTFSGALGATWWGQTAVCWPWGCLGSGGVGLWANDSLFVSVMSPPPVGG